MKNFVVIVSILLASVVIVPVAAMTFDALSVGIPAVFNFAVR